MNSKHPKFGDGRRAVLGERAWDPSSHDGFAGPHQVTITAIFLNGDVEIEFGKNERCTTLATNIYKTKAGATHAR